MSTLNDYETGTGNTPAPGPGPDTAMRALPSGPRTAGFAVLHAARADGWRVPEVEAAMREMSREILRLREQVAAVQVDRDRGIRDAMKRAEDCVEHGATIRSESHQAHWFSVLADANNEERVAWLSACQEIRKAFAEQQTDIGRQVVKFIDAAARDAKRIQGRRSAPTFADCQRAGRCEHPPTGQHAPCEKLRTESEAA